MFYALLLLLLFFVLIFLGINSLQEIINTYTNYRLKIKFKKLLIISGVLATNLWLVILGLIHLTHL